MLVPLTWILRLCFSFILLFQSSESKCVSTSGKADENGHLFGSVNAAAVAKLLEEKGFGIEEKDVRLGAPIKAVGTHEVPVHVHGEHTATVQVEVTAEA